jgi:hypothetical protein
MPEAPMPEAPMAPSPAAPTEEKPLNQSELDAMFGPAPPAPPASAMDEGSAAKTAPPLSPEELDKVLAQPEPGAIESVAAEDAGKEGATPTDIENLPEPEPIPGALAPDEGAGEGRRRSGGWSGPIAAIAVLALLIGAGAGLYFGRDTVMRMVPMTKEIYSRLGLGGEALGAGLDIRSVASERVNEGGVEVLAVRGVIANISPIERAVPNLRVALFDANNRMVQSADSAPAKARLAPAGEMGFRIGLRDPSPLARRLEVTFIEGTLNPDGALPGDAKPAAPQGETKGETKSGG